MNRSLFHATLFSVALCSCTLNLELGDRPEGDAGIAHVNDGGPNPTPVSPFSVKKLSAHGNHTCALFENGRVKCWGDNQYGQLGIGKSWAVMAAASSPSRANTGPWDIDYHQEPIDPYDWLQAICGGHVPCDPPGGSPTSHRPEACNSYLPDVNYPGEHACIMGDEPNETGVGLPYVELGAGRFATSIAAGYGQTCAILDNGKVKCWGYGPSLGLGDYRSRGDGPNEMGDALPFVDLGTNRTAIGLAANSQATCAILDDGKVKCWGSNYFGALGIPDANATYYPQGWSWRYWGFEGADIRGARPSEMGDALAAVDLGIARRATALALGDGACAVLDDGNVKCWGRNASADHPYVGTAEMKLGDALVNLRLVARSVVAGADGHSCALLENARVACWGPNTWGGLGTGDKDERRFRDTLSYVNLGSGRTARAIAAGGHHTCAVLDNGRIKCWGDNRSGQLGVADADTRGFGPGQMGDALPYVELGSNRTVRAIAAGFEHTCAVLDNGRVKCWGDNKFGQLGLGYTKSRGDSPDEMGDALDYVDLGTGQP